MEATLKSKLLYPIVVALAVGAISVSAKAIIDVSVLKNDKQAIKESLADLNTKVDRIIYFLLNNER